MAALFAAPFLAAAFFGAAFLAAAFFAAAFLAAFLAGFFLAAASPSPASGGLFGGGGDKNVTPTVGDRVPVLSRIESGASVDPALASVSVVLPPAKANTTWAMASGVPSKSYGNLALSTNPTRVWSAKIAAPSLAVLLVLVLRGMKPALPLSRPAWPPYLL